MSNKLGSVLGIDYGTSKIGLAISPDGKIAFSFDILSNNGVFFSILEKLIKDNEVEKIVVGLPISMSGNPSAQTKIVEGFIEQLKKKTNIPIEKYDERLTSTEAKRNLPPKVKDDAEAARIILQGYLDKNTYQP